MLMTQVPRNRRLSMGDVTRIFDLTPRAVRFYEQKGLIRPGRDRLNCRYYDGEATSRLQLIAELRAAGLGLAEIGNILEVEINGSGGTTIVATYIADRRRRIADELARLDAIAARLFDKPTASNDSSDDSRSNRPLPVLVSCAPSQ